MLRIHHRRLFAIGVFTFTIGVFNLGIFYNEVIKTNIKQNSVEVTNALSFEGGNIHNHGSDTDTVHSNHPLRKLENHKNILTTESIDSCQGSNCRAENKIRNTEGKLNSLRFRERVSKSANFRFSDKSLETHVVRDRRVRNDSYFYLRPETINALPSKIVLHNQELCSLPGRKRPYLLVLIPSVGGHFTNRETVRQTWASSSYNGGTWANVTLQATVRTLFILGTHNYTVDQMAAVREEAAVYGDLLMSDFVDSYRNLSLKMAVGLAWSAQFCNGVSHVIKVDEDTFVFMPKLLTLLKRTELEYERFAMGYMHINPSPYVVRRGRWMVDQKLYPMPTYPRYLYGHSYVISGPAIPTLLSAFFRMPLVTNEDALFTGILPVVTDVIRLAHRSFGMSLRHEVLCDVVNGNYLSITSCCNKHHELIYQAFLDGSCTNEQLNEMYIPGCRYVSKDRRN